LAIGLGWVGTATAQLPNDAQVCPDDDPKMDKYEYLRALSLDLRGVIPTVDELLALDGERGVSLDLIDDWMNQPEFVEQVVRFHRRIFWPNIEGHQLLNNGVSLSKDGDLYYRKAKATMYRGAAVSCLDMLEADPDNIQPVDQGNGVAREGYVLVNPYWAPTTTIKVCAFDAQTTEIAGSGIDCDTRDALNEPACGCGPDLRRCRYSNLHQAVNRAFGADLDLRVAHMIENQLNYTDLFTDRTAFVNGPIVHFLKNQTAFFAGLSFQPVAYNLEQLPDLAFTDTDFVPVDLPVSHAGVLSSPAFLLRFQTNRSRANRFYEALKCKPFSAPEEGLLAVANEEAAMEPDLQIRQGCKDCHSLLEGAASHWGRWTETGAGYLDSAVFPVVDEDCVMCAMTGLPCSDSCKKYYMVDPLSPEEETFAGWLLSYVFRGEDQYPNVEYGPHALVMKSIGDNSLPECLTRSVAEWLLGRAITDDEEAWVTEIATEFVHTGFQFRDLVQAIVTSQTYRRLR